TAISTATASRQPRWRNPGSTAPRNVMLGLPRGGWLAGLDEFFAAVPEAEVLHALPDGVSVTFDLRGDGGGTWTVSRDGGRTEVRRHRQAAADCHLTCTVSDFRAL